LVWARQLEDGARPAIEGEAERGHLPPHRAGSAVAVEEDEVEREAHAKGVDAAAAWDQEPGPRLVAGETGQAEQTGAAAAGDTHLAAENFSGREIAQSASSHDL